MPTRWLLLLILLLPLPLQPAEAPAPATQSQPAAQPPMGGQPAGTAPSAPLFTDAEWQRGQGTGATTPPDGGVVGKAAVGLLLSLVAIAVVAAGLAFALRKLGMRRVLPGRGRHLTVIETVPLGFKRSVSLLRIGDQVLVVGQGEHDLSHLATLPASVLDASQPKPSLTEVVDTATTPTTSTTPPALAFRAVLEIITGRRA
ncbi:MAG TPA: flagellar biosynthetic protein FliO [Planctomycetota bacterium]|nr:flagellar biosynthetic protein FliO [Planctomycetota bacterium]